MCFASEAYLGVGVPQSATLLVACAQAAPYFKGGMSGGIRLYAEPAAVRAWPGGAGSHKLAGNYAPTIVSMRDARAGAEPYDDVLWLFGEDRQITEVGSSNFAAVLGKPDGGAELVTAPLSRGDILPGVTRDSVLHLARGMEAEGLTVSERTLTISDIAAAEKAGLPRMADTARAINACLKEVQPGGKRLNQDEPNQKPEITTSKTDVKRTITDAGNVALALLVAFFLGCTYLGFSIDESTGVGRSQHPQIPARSKH